MSTSIFLLLVIFQIKHYLADYPLQTPYMLRKFLPNWQFVLPLAAHSGVHALFTFLIAMLIKSELAIQLAFFDFAVHFTVDRIKADPGLLGRFKALSAKEFPTATEEQKKHNNYFWFALGADQFMHHITHYIIIYFLLA